MSNPLWVNFCIWYKTRVHFYCFAFSYLLFPALPAEETVLSPGSGLGTLIENHLVIYMCVIISELSVLSHCSTWAYLTFRKEGYFGAPNLTTQALWEQRVFAGWSHEKETGVSKIWQRLAAETEGHKWAGPKCSSRSWECPPVDSQRLQGNEFCQKSRWGWNWAFP